MVSLIPSCSLAEAFTAFIIICSIVFWWMCVSFHFLCYSLVSLVNMPYSSGDWWQGWGESCFLSTWTQPHNHLTTRTCKTHIHTHTSKLHIYCDSFLYVSGSQSAQLRATLCIIINRKTFFFHQPDELTFEEGEMLYILDMSDKDWWKAKCGARSGLIPSNYGKTFFYCSWLFFCKRMP